MKRETISNVIKTVGEYLSDWEINVIKNSICENSYNVVSFDEPEKFMEYVSSINEKVIVDGRIKYSNISTPVVVIGECKYGKDFRWINEGSIVEQVKLPAKFDVNQKLISSIVTSRYQDNTELIKELTLAFYIPKKH